tara:strand:+ start:4315 stop:4521 length:207 start_codon:yes stop_codon:yes gene_type:complete
MKLKEFKEKLQNILEDDIKETEMSIESLEERQDKYNVDESIEISYDESRVNSFEYVIELLNKIESEVK